MLYSPTIGEFFVVIFRSRMLCPAFSGASPRIYPVTDSPVGFCTVINVCAPLPPLEIWSLVTVQESFAAGGVCWGNRSVPVLSASAAPFGEQARF